MNAGGGGSSSSAKATTPMKLTSCSLIECGPHRTTDRITQSRGVSWNASGSYLGMACSDSTVRLWSIDPAGSSAKEVLIINTSGGQHTGPVRSAKFQPASDAILCSTGATDDTVCLWDARGGGAAPKMIGKIDCSTPIVSTQWNGVQTHVLAVTTRDGSVSVYDTRKISSTASTTTKATSAVHTVSLQPDMPEACIFDPTGDYLVAGTTNRGQGMGYLKIWNWKQQGATPIKYYHYPAHAGPIYTMAFTSGKRRLLATGGSDALVGLWDVATMTCCHTVTSRTKFVRSVAFSADAKVLAIATEEDVVELVDVGTNTTGRGAFARIGLASLGLRPHSAGTEDVAFHPTSHYLLACARTESMVAPPTAPVTVMKLTVSQ